MALTYEQVLMFLYMLVAVMLIIVLYHAIFIVVDLRKVMKRVEEVTNELQAIIMKPVSIADQIMDYAMEFLNQKKHEAKKHNAIDKK